MKSGESTESESPRTHGANPPFLFPIQSKCNSQPQPSICRFNQCLNSQFEFYFLIGSILRGRTKSECRGFLITMAVDLSSISLHKDPSPNFTIPTHPHSIFDSQGEAEVRETKYGQAGYREQRSKEQRK